MLNKDKIKSYIKDITLLDDNLIIIEPNEKNTRSKGGIMIGTLKSRYDLKEGYVVSLSEDMSSPFMENKFLYKKVAYKPTEEYELFKEEDEDYVYIFKCINLKDIIYINKGDIIG